MLGDESHHLIDDGLVFVGLYEQEVNKMEDGRNQESIPKGQLRHSINIPTVHGHLMWAAVNVLNFCEGADHAMLNQERGMRGTSVGKGQEHGHHVVVQEQLRSRIRRVVRWVHQLKQASGSIGLQDFTKEVSEQAVLCHISRPLSSWVVVGKQLIQDSKGYRTLLSISNVRITSDSLDEGESGAIQDLSRTGMQLLMLQQDVL
jgi:hypothetical protein